MPKITFMGAGSTVFAKSILGDSLLRPALQESEIALYDIDPGRLNESKLVMDSLNANINEGRATVTAHLGVEQRKDALRNANYVINAIQVGGYEPCTVTDFEIPKKYGLRQTIADTIGRCKGAVNSWACVVPLIWKSGIWDGLAELLTAATGFEFKGRDIEDTADRIHAVERAFNVRQGITIEHDNLPQKPEVKESPEGERQRRVHFQMLRRYYHTLGYDPDTGIPLPETLNRLGIPEIGERVHNDGPYPLWDGPPLWEPGDYPKDRKKTG